MAAGAVRVTGIVLNTIPIGEYDRRLVILTREKGKITVFAKGARRPTSAFLACTQPFTYAAFDVYAGRNSYHLQSADNTRYFPKIREDLDSICYAMFFCELADYYSRENNDDLELLKLLYKSLSALNSEKIDKRLACTVFEWRSYYVNGTGARVFECIKCKKTDQLHFFSAGMGGVLCENCMEKAADAKRICDSSLYTLQYIASSGLDKLYDFRVTENVQEELDDIVKSYRDIHIDREFRSLDGMDKLILANDEDRS